MTFTTDGTGTFPALTIAANAINTGKINTDAVATSAILNTNVTNAKLGADVFSSAHSWSATNSFTATGNTTYSVATSSGMNVTAGMVSMGWERASHVCGAAVSNCTQSCTGGKILVGGGCEADQPLKKSFPATEYQWECDTTVNSTALLTAYALCARIGP